MSSENRVKTTVFAGKYSNTILELGKRIENRNIFYLGEEITGDNPFKEHIVLSENNWENTINDFFLKNKRVDLLVLDPGVIQYNFQSVILEQINQIKWNELVERPIMETYRYIKYFSKNMSRFRYGRIVILLSAIDALLEKGSFIASTLNYALKALISTAARELARYNILINGIVCGFISYKNIYYDKELLSHIPINRGGTPEELLGIINFLEARDSGFITGQVISMDGGMSC
ncbi:MAG: SDR family oxidoreductase [Spirochaetales bacterium]|nr:SDR family oxidoreductase [Spirochaetales bacterium]